MTKEAGEVLKQLIESRAGVYVPPPYALTAWDDRERYREYVFKRIDEFVQLTQQAP